MSANTRSTLRPAQLNDTRCTFGQNLNGKQICNANGRNTNNYDLKNQTLNENFAMQRVFYEKKERVYQ